MNILVPQRKLVGIRRTLRLGTGPEGADGFRRAIAGNSVRMRISKQADIHLDRAVIAPPKTLTVVDSVTVLVADLGLLQGDTYDNICARARELGGDYCSDEFVPQARLQFEDLPKRKWNILATRPIVNPNGDYNLFFVVNGDGGLWLDSWTFPRSHIFYGDMYFTFLLLSP